MSALLALLLLAVPDPVARVAAAQGLAIRAEGDTVARPSRRGDRVPDGALLSLAAGGSATIELGPHRMTLGPARTIVRVRGGSLANYQVLVLEGMTRHKVDRLPDHAGYSVTTAVGSAGVRGTEFTVASGADGASYVGVSEGEVAVGAGVGEEPTTVEEGSAVARAPGRDLESIRAWDDEEVDTWIADRNRDFEEDPTAAAAAADAEAAAAAEKGREAMEARAALGARIASVVASGALSGGAEIEEALDLLVEALAAARISSEARARVEAAAAVAARARAARPDLAAGGTALAAEADFESEHARRAEEAERTGRGLESLVNLIRVARAASLIPRGGFSLPF